MKRWPAAAVTALMFCSLAASQAQEKRSSVGGDIVIPAGSTAGDVACVLCSVYVHGHVEGKVSVVMGDVVVDGSVDDKIALVMGDLKILPGGVVHGDVAIAAGGMENQGKVDGETRQSGGRSVGRVGIVIGLFFLLLPVLVVVLIIWLIVRAVRRPRYPNYPPGPPPPMAPMGYPPTR